MKSPFLMFNSSVKTGVISSSVITGGLPRRSCNGRQRKVEGACHGIPSRLDLMMMMMNYVKLAILQVNISNISRSLP